jgi:hypothetical protein
LLLPDVPRGYNGPMLPKTYTDLYYRDFFYFTRKVRGNHTLIMARPYEGILIFIKNLKVKKKIIIIKVWKGVAIKFAPRDVVFSGWVG